MITTIIITITAIYFFGCGMAYEKITTIRAEIRAEDGSSPSWYDYKRIIIATVMSWGFIVLFIVDGRK